tara:strand:+ start:162 stop:533 length:372 start_codon:yes stop_codon:yes gene_type:complete
MPNLQSTKLTTEGRTITSTSAGASADVVYTVPTNYSAIIKFLHLSNGTNSSKKASVQFFDAASSAYKFILNEFSMSGHTAHDVVSGNELALHQGDKIVAFIEAGMTLDVVISVQEYYDPARQN